MAKELERTIRYMFHAITGRFYNVGINDDDVR
jgi:hypothetical protein